jgi:ABC-type Fe3+/spermidine/putrescine transport system ATPase subunit
MLEVSRLRKSYGGVPVLADISFGVAKGEFVSIVGPSGCGKTTLLKCPRAWRWCFRNTGARSIPG